MVKISHLQSRKIHNILFIGMVTVCLLASISLDLRQVLTHFNVAQRAHAIRFYDDVLFQNGTRANTMNEIPNTYKIVTGVIPHHLLASGILSGYFSRLARQNPKRIILIGPNHHETGKAPVIASRLTWQTPYGDVYPDQEILESILSKGRIQIDEDVSETEHSISGLTAYIAYYMPGAKIIPLIVSGRMQFADIMELSEILSEYIDTDTVLLSSVDFSHYLFSDEARRRDEITEEVMRNYSYEQIFQMNSDYLDSPPAVMMAMRVGEILGARNMDILAHTNSGILQKNGSMPTTSYFSIAFHE